MTYASVRTSLAGVAVDLLDMETQGDLCRAFQEIAEILRTAKTEMVRDKLKEIQDGSQA